MTSKLSPLNVFLDSDNILRVEDQLSKHQTLSLKKQQQQQKTALC